MPVYLVWPPGVALLLEVVCVIGFLVWCGSGVACLLLKHYTTKQQRQLEREFEQSHYFCPMTGRLMRR